METHDQHRHDAPLTRDRQVPVLAFTGAAFDSWDSTWLWSDGAHVFNADDLVAITFLSVRVQPRAAYVFNQKQSRFSELLRG